MKSKILILFILSLGIKLFGQMPCADEHLSFGDFLFKFKKQIEISESEQKTHIIEIINFELNLLKSIFSGLNKGKLFLLQNKFETLGNAVKSLDLDKICVTDLRRLRTKFEEFKKYITDYQKINETLLTPEEIVLINYISQFNSILCEEILKDDFFDIDGFERAFDNILIRPFEWIKGNPKTAVVGLITPLIFLGIYNFWDYVPVCMKADIPPGVFTESCIARQKEATCGAVAAARALQKVKNIPDSETETFRSQKFQDWDNFRRGMIKKRSQNCKKTKKRLASIPAESCKLFNWMNSEEVRDLVNFEVWHKNIEKYDILVLDYYWYFALAKCKNLDELETTYLQGLREKKRQLLTGVIERIHLILGPITRTTEVDGRSHFLYYEITRSDHPFGFHIHCDDSLNFAERRRWGAEFLYNVLRTNHLSELYKKS